MSNNIKPDFRKITNVQDQTMQHSSISYNTHKKLYTEIRILTTEARQGVKNIVNLQYLST